MAGPRRRPFFAGFVTYVIIVVLEALSVLAMVSELESSAFVNMLLAFAFHLGAATMLTYGFWGPWDFRYPDEKNWSVIGFVLVLAIPVYGLIGLSGAYAAVHWRRRFERAGAGIVGRFEEYIHYEPEVRSELRGMALMSDGDLPQDLERLGKVAPLIDVIKSGDPELKRGAIFSIAKLKPETAVKVLRECLKDIDPDSQFFVAGQLSRIEKTLSESIIRTRRRLELDPDNLDLRIELARQEKDYILSGLLDPSVEQYFLREASGLCEEVLSRLPDRDDVLLDLADIRLRARQTDVALQAYAQIVEQDPTLTPAWIGLAHCYYEKRDLLRLGAVLEELKSRGELPPSLNDVLAFWDMARPS
ncbi:MAG: hypothetical protein IV100_05340 [Myxococcales bacterium]|nr:hypothetical protein [Myxococcales bacterium]